jgi:hypothetical protein
MIREGRIARPQVRQARMFGNACGFAAPPRKAAARFYAGANTSILSGSGTVSPEPFQDFYHRSLRLPAPEVMHGEPDSLNYPLKLWAPDRVARAKRI